MALAKEIRRYLIGRHVAAEVAADIVQDMFVKVLEMALILAPDKLRPYLYRVAWSTYLDWYRREQRLQRLRPADRKLLVDRYYHQRALGLMANDLGVSTAAVKMRLQRVQRKLRKHLGGEITWGKT